MPRKVFTVEEAAELVTAGDCEGTAEIVMLPPDNDPDVSDEEDINDEVLGEADIRDIPGTIEVHNDGFLEAENPDSDEEPAPKVRRERNTQKTKGAKTEECKWYQGEHMHDNLAYDKPDPLEETHPLLLDKSPYELFSLFFDDRMVDLLVEETIRYANQKLNHQFSVQKTEMETFLGILLLSGYHILPQEHLYWCTDEDVGVPAIAKKNVEE